MWGQTGSQSVAEIVGALDSVNAYGSGRLLANAQGFETLDQAFRWAIAQTPRVMPDDVVIQDE
jgi:hypothetical protein